MWNGISTVSAGGRCPSRLTLGRELAKRGSEQGLVDAALEYRDAHLHAFADHLLPFHVKLVGKLGRGQVIGHVLGPPLVEIE